MCTDDQRFTTAVGPRWSIEQFLRVLPDTGLLDRHVIDSAELVDLGGLSPEFKEDMSPAVAVIEHHEGLSFSIAADLQAYFLVGDPERHIDALPWLLFEPGYEFRATASAPGPAVSIKQSSFNRLHSTQPANQATDRAGGSRVAVLDTGDARASNQMADFLQRPPVQVAPDDRNGHGTAVAEVISTLAPTADIHPVRVLDANATGASYRVLAGLAYALWSGLFDIVNASLTSTTTSVCEHSLGTSIGYIVSTCIAHRPGTLPLLVAAAGNDSTKNAGYPAVVPGAIVALALEEDPPASGTFMQARYNSTPPQGAAQHEAFGGSSADPIGSLATQHGAQTSLYGTSFATAAVTAAHLP
jgi:hypothetical protein